jgi:hypothetical protein
VALLQSFFSLFLSYSLVLDFFVCNTKTNHARNVSVSSQRLSDVLTAQKNILNDKRSTRIHLEGCNIVAKGHCMPSLKSASRKFHFLSLFLSLILAIIFYASILYIGLENRAIPTDTIHDPTDTVQANTFAKMLNKCSRISVMGDKAANRVLHLNGHLFLLVSYIDIIQSIL